MQEEGYNVLPLKSATVLGRAETQDFDKLDDAQQELQRARYQKQVEDRKNHGPLCKVAQPDEVTYTPTLGCGTFPLPVSRDFFRQRHEEKGFPTEGEVHNKDEFTIFPEDVRDFVLRGQSTPTTTKTKTKTINDSRARSYRIVFLAVTVCFERFVQQRQRPNSESDVDGAKCEVKL